MLASKGRPPRHERAEEGIAVSAARCLIYEAFSGNGTRSSGGAQIRRD